MVIKMFTELGRRIYEHRENFNNEMKNISVTNRSHGAEKHNNGSEKYTRRVQKHIKWSRIKDWLTQRQDSGIHPIRATKREKNEKKWK